VSTQRHDMRSEFDQETIATLAYFLWQIRGCPHGSPEADWFRAEAELRNLLAAESTD